MSNISKLLYNWSESLKGRLPGLSFVSFSYTVGEEGVGSNVYKQRMADLKSEVITNSDKLRKSQMWLQIKYRSPPVHGAQKPSHKSL